MRQKTGLFAATCALLLGLLVGCGNYTVTMNVADVINAAGDDNTKQMLDVDIVCLRGKDAKRWEELARGGVRADEWFKLRDEKSSKLAGLEDRIYMLADKSRDLPGKVIGAPLLSGVDYKGETRRVFKGVRFPEFTQGDAVILIYGRFYDGKGGVRRNDPIRLAPPPANDKIEIRIDRQNMAVAQSK